MPATGSRLHEIVRIINRRSNHYKDLGVVVGFTATAFIVRLPSGDIPYLLEDIELASRLRNKAPSGRYREPSPSTMPQRTTKRHSMRHYRMCFPEGSKVKVISGSYTGEVGTIVCLTKSRVAVRIPWVERNVFLLPKNIRLVDVPPASSSDESTDSSTSNGWTDVYLMEDHIGRSRSVSIDSYLGRG
jgi:hypothetical protein